MAVFSILLSTTGTLSPVPIDDLGAIEFVHPTVDFPLVGPGGTYTPADIAGSVDLQAAIDAGYITLADQNGEPINVVAEAILTLSGLADVDFPTPPQDGEVLTFDFAAQNWHSDPLPAGVGVDEDQIIYVGKHGNDANDGKAIGKAVLTFGQALTLAAAETPSATNVWAIICLDGGTYTEDIALTVPFVRIFAAEACIEGKLTVATDTSFEFEFIEFTGTGFAVELVSGTGTAYGEIKYLEISGGNADGIRNATNGILNIEIEFFRQSDGIGLENDTAITHADIQDWDLHGTSAIAVQNLAGTLNLRSANLADRTAASSLIFDVDGGVVNAVVGNVSGDTLCDVEVGATLNVIAATVSGTRLEDGTVNILHAAHINDFTNPHQVTATQAGAVSLTINENVSGIKRFQDQIVLNDQGDTSTVSPPYVLSLQDGDGDGYAYIEILTDRAGSTFGGPDRGAFFGMEDNGNSLAQQEFTLYNWQGGPIVFYTGPAPSSGTKRLIIENDGTLNVGDTLNYETLVTDDDDIPNKKYVDDEINTNAVLTTTNQNVAGVKTFTDDVPLVVNASTPSNQLEIGWFDGTTVDCYGIRNSDASGLFCLMPNSDNPQIFLGTEDNTTGQAFIDVDNNRPLNLNVLDTGDGTPALVRIGSGGLDIVSGGNITLGASNTVDGVDVGSPKNSIEVDANQYQLVGDAPAPGNSKLYGTNASGVKGWYDQPVGGGASIPLEWKFDNATGASNPGTGLFRLNNSTPASATAVYINDEDENGLDASTLLNGLDAGDNIYIQQIEDGTRFVLATINTVTDNTGWFTLGITVNDSGTLFEDGKECQVILLYSAPGNTGDVTAAANITDNAIVRGDGGAKGVQDSAWSINDLGQMTSGVSVAGYALDVHNTLTTGGGNGFTIMAGEQLGDIAFHVADSDDSFQILELEADQGFITMGKTYAQTLLDNGVVYGFDNQNDGVSSDFNCQEGQYRMAGVPIPIKKYDFHADQVDFPFGADFTVTAGAPANRDTNNAALTVRRFDDTIEEGIGLNVAVPEQAIEMIIRTTARAETTPGGAVVAVPKLYKRAIPNNGAVSAWTSNTLTNIDLPTNENFQYDETSNTLAGWGLTAGEKYQFEFTRDAGNVADTLTGDLSVYLVEVEFR